MKLGAHMSIAGGVDKSILRGHEVGCDTIQIFTRSSNQWKARPLTPEEIRQFKENREATGIEPIVAHDSYLINLCAPDAGKEAMSVESFAVELERCRLLEVPYLVMHPGSHLGKGEEWGLKKIADNLNKLLRNDEREGAAMVLLETTAGQGSNLGYRFEHLKSIRDMIESKQRIGICLDTAHILAAGYDIRTGEGFDKVLEEFDKLLGLENLKCIHLNDSKKEHATRVDRHEHIGKGFIGIEAFRYLMNKKEFSDIPMILETPKDEIYTEDKENLRILRSLIE